METDQSLIPFQLSNHTPGYYSESLP